MILFGSVIVIALISFLWAVMESRKELNVPPELKGVKIRKKKNISGVILFLKKKIIHYSSESADA
jgi:hypothetical protein